MGFGGLIIWAFAARVPVMKASSQARIEPHNAVHRLEPPGAGRVVRSMLKLDENVKKGDLLIEFDTRSERLELEQSKATVEALNQELAVIRDQITNKKDEFAASNLVDEVAVREAAERESELAPRHRLAEQRAQLAQKSPTGAISELEKLERLTEVDAIQSATRAQSLALVRLRREQAVKRQTLNAQLLSLKREELRIEGQLRELKVTTDRLEYQIERKHYRAAVSGRLVDVAELGSGAFIAEGQRLGTILAADAKVRVRARFPKEMVGLIHAEARRLSLDDLRDRACHGDARRHRARHHRHARGNSRHGARRARSSRAARPANPDPARYDGVRGDRSRPCLSDRAADAGDRRMGHLATSC
jgi:hemolysin D